MVETVVLVRCPRCGSMDAESVEPLHIEFDRMRCHSCGHEQICDHYQIKLGWNETVSKDRVPHVVWHLLPDERFFDLWRALGARSHGRPAFERLRDAYGEPHRAYHTARHIGACLRLFDQPDVKRLATRVAEVEAALWFHDAIYDTHARTNEEESAALATELLLSDGVAPEVAERVAAHVLATRGHVADTGDTQLVLDIDLAILGAKTSEYARFEQEIRAEYAWVDEEAYRAGRSAVLRSFLERDRIYGAAVLRERLEARARSNLATALSQLVSPGALPA
jgi:predicted metal-dependent HD superfamily phosphohydrolase